MNGITYHLEWFKMKRILRYGDPTAAMQLLKDASERFGEDGKYLLAVGRQYSLLCEIEEAKKSILTTQSEDLLSIFAKPIGRVM